MDDLQPTQVEKQSLTKERSHHARLISKLLMLRALYRDQKQTTRDIDYRLRDIRNSQENTLRYPERIPDPEGEEQEGQPTRVQPGLKAPDNSLRPGVATIGIGTLIGRFVKFFKEKFATQVLDLEVRDFDMDALQKIEFESFGKMTFEAEQRQKIIFKADKIEFAREDIVEDFDPVEEEAEELKQEEEAKKVEAGEPKENPTMLDRWKPFGLRREQPKEPENPVDLKGTPRPDPNTLMDGPKRKRSEKKPPQDAPARAEPEQRETVSAPEKERQPIADRPEPEQRQEPVQPKRPVPMGHPPRETVKRQLHDSVMKAEPQPEEEKIAPVERSYTESHTSRIKNTLQGIDRARAMRNDSQGRLVQPELKTPNIPEYESEDKREMLQTPERAKKNMPLTQYFPPTTDYSGYTPIEEPAYNQGSGTMPRVTGPEIIESGEEDDRKPTFINPWDDISGAPTFIK